jgi:hypothetical protein
MVGWIRFVPEFFVVSSFVLGVFVSFCARDVVELIPPACDSKG